jgi:hypothetical protein
MYYLVILYCFHSLIGPHACMGDACFNQFGGLKLTKRSLTLPVKSFKFTFCSSEFGRLFSPKPSAYNYHSHWLNSLLGPVKMAGEFNLSQGVQCYPSGAAPDQWQESLLTQSPLIAVFQVCSERGHHSGVTSRYSLLKQSWCVLDKGHISTSRNRMRPDGRGWAHMETIVMHPHPPSCEKLSHDGGWGRMTMVSRRAHPRPSGLMRFRLPLMYSLVTSWQGFAVEKTNK